MRQQIRNEISLKVHWNDRRFKTPGKILRKKNRDFSFLFMWHLHRRAPRNKKKISVWQLKSRNSLRLLWRIRGNFRYGCGSDISKSKPISKKNTSRKKFPIWKKIHTLWHLPPRVGRKRRRMGKWTVWESIWKRFWRRLESKKSGVSHFAFS